jgi:cyanophycin synthetase
MDVSRIRALRGPNLEPTHRHRGHRFLPGPSASSTTCPASNCACAPASQIGFLEPDGGKQVVSMAHALAAPPWPAGAGRLPGHLQPHRATVETGIYQVVVEYSEEEVGRLAFDLALELCRPPWRRPST